MAFRVLFIEKDTSIRVQLDNMIVQKDGTEIWIPLDDIAVIVLDNLRISLTTRILCSLAQHNVGLITCDQEHLPIGYFSSYDNHSRVSKILGYQINKTYDFYDRHWREIVAHKIENQCQVLQVLQKDISVQCSMRDFIAELTDGDRTNREAHAAKIYFNELMGCTFSRGNEDLLLNSGLDYGYSVIRAYIARCCVGYGLNSQLGFHHKNEYNRFNLVDDLIEPIRPFVDLYAYQLLKDETYFKREHRLALVNILNHKIVYRDKKMYFSNMIEEYVMQFAMLLSDRRDMVNYPRLIDYIGERDA